MFGRKYSRIKFWIGSLILMILNIPLMILSNAPVGDIENTSVLQIIFVILIFSLPSIIWLNTLANRIRDYGSNPWLSLLALIPLVNIIMAFYYGIKQYKTGMDNSSSINEDEFYEQAMEEVESDDKVKGIWAKAFAKAEGNESRAKAMYINVRAKLLIQEKNESEEKSKKQRQETLALRTLAYSSSKKKYHAISSDSTVEQLKVLANDKDYEIKKRAIEELQKREGFEFITLADLLGGIFGGLLMLYYGLGYLIDTFNISSYLWSALIIPLWLIIPYIETKEEIEKSAIT